MIPRRHAMTLGLASLAVAMLRPATPARADQDAPVVAAASDLKFALTDIAAAFTADTGMQVTLVFGSTGIFATQIRQGAPFQMFMAADESFVAQLHQEGLTRDEGQLYAVGRIVLMAPHGSSLVPDPAMDSLARLLDEGRITRLAIANPDHAPYGLRAKQALIHRGLWDRIEPLLVLGENVSQAAQFALSGNVDGGIIAYSLALAPDLAAQGRFALIPEDWHEALLQRMVLLNAAGPVADAFYAYVQQQAARDIMVKYGFALPERS